MRLPTRLLDVGLAAWDARGVPREPVRLTALAFGACGPDRRAGLRRRAVLGRSCLNAVAPEWLQPRRIRNHRSARLRLLRGIDAVTGVALCIAARRDIAHGSFGNRIDAVAAELLYLLRVYGAAGNRDAVAMAKVANL